MYERERARKCMSYLTQLDEHRKAVQLCQGQDLLVSVHVYSSSRAMST